MKILTAILLFVQAVIPVVMEFIASSKKDPETKYQEWFKKYRPYVYLVLVCVMFFTIAFTTIDSIQSQESEIEREKENLANTIRDIDSLLTENETRILLQGKALNSILLHTNDFLEDSLFSELVVLQTEFDSTSSLLRSSADLTLSELSSLYQQVERNRKNYSTKLDSLNRVQARLLLESIKDLVTVQRSGELLVDSFTLRFPLRVYLEKPLFSGFEKKEVAKFLDKMLYQNRTWNKEGKEYWNFAENVFVLKNPNAEYDIYERLPSEYRDYYTHRDLMDPNFYDASHKVGFSSKPEELWISPLVDRNMPVMPYSMYPPFTVTFKYSSDAYVRWSDQVYIHKISVKEIDYFVNSNNINFYIEIGFRGVNRGEKVQLFSLLDAELLVGPNDCCNLHRDDKQNCPDVSNLIRLEPNIDIDSVRFGRKCFIETPQGERIRMEYQGLDYHCYLCYKLHGRYSVPVEGFIE